MPRVLHRFVAGSAVHWWSVHLYLHLSGMCFFRPCILTHFRVIQNILFLHMFFWHHFREPKAISIVANENAYQTKKQSHSGLPNPKLISRSRECSISASCTAPVSWKMVCKHLFHEFHVGPFCRLPCCYIKTSLYLIHFIVCIGIGAGA